MHFWIDKRSQQCGFGRSRVAATLSASSCGGVGLGFGHPPRRMHSGNKSYSTSMTVSNSNTLASIHGTSRAQQQQQHQNHHQQQQQSFSTPSTSSNAAIETASTDCCNSSSSSRIYHQQPQQLLSNNNNLQGYIGNQSSIQQQSRTQQHNNVNNNPQHQQKFNSINICAGSIIAPNTINNNHQSRYGGISTSTSLLHQHHHQLLQHEMRYHHPQFGNMSVRHCQPMSSGSNSNDGSVEVGLNSAIGAIAGTTSNVATPGNEMAYQRHQQQIYQRMQQQQQVPGFIAHTYDTIFDETQTGATVVGSNFIPQHHHQTAIRQSMNYSSTPHRATYSLSQCIRGGGGNVINTSNSSNNNNTNIITDATTHHYHNQQQHQHVHHRQLHTLIDHSETQLLPSHLKSGVCASLILASIFVAAAKFYFDHQNSGLEVLIFIAFSMTFLLAACTVSLCRIPKGMIVQRPTNLHGEHAAVAGNTTVCTAALSIGDTGGGNGGGGVQINRNDVLAMSSQCQQILFTRPLAQEHALAAQAGPPPYHIAILLPENACKDEEESPPPSYDKIII